MPVGVVVARVAGDIARPGNAPLVPTEAGRMLGIFDLLVVVIFAYVDSFKVAVKRFSTCRYAGCSTVKQEGA